MALNKRSVLILVADDDEEDRMLVKEALEESRLINALHFVEDGEELMDYLKNKGKYSDKKKISPSGTYSSGPEYAQEGRQRGFKRN